MRLLLFFVCLFITVAAQADEAKLKKINHIIVLTLENHSFDNIFGYFPGADGIANAKELQKDLSGKPYTTLPPVKDTRQSPAVVDARFPKNLPNNPFLIEPYVPANQKTGDLVHSFYRQQQQINKGKMDRFAALSDAGGLTMGYYDGSKTALWKYAREYTLADRFFHASFGGSFINHLWMICACTPRYEHAPEELKVQFDKKGHVIKENPVTPDGYVVNTLLPEGMPHAANAKRILPLQTMPTIGDRLSEKNIKWAWYSGGWNVASTGQHVETFQSHHQPFTYFKQFAPGTEARKEHLKDEDDFINDINQGTLPAVAFYKPLGEFNLHPGYADIASGDNHIAVLIETIKASPIWKDSVIILTFDENGGYWDHVAPPKIDRWGPGIRIPTIIISPFAKKGFVDHTTYDTTSILKLIETRYGLKPLGTRDAAANNMLNVLE